MNNYIGNDGQTMDQVKTRRDSKNITNTMTNNNNMNSGSRNKSRKDISPVKNNFNNENTGQLQQE